MKKVAVFLMVLFGMSVAVRAQLPPPAVQMYVNIGGVPTAVTSTLTSGQLTVPPPAMLAKCMNGSLIVDCDFGGGGGGGTVTLVSVVTANGVSGTVANASTTPAITLVLGAITPSSVSTASGGNLKLIDVGGGYNAVTLNGVAGTAGYEGITGGGDTSLYVDAASGGIVFRLNQVVRGQVNSNGLADSNGNPIPSIPGTPVAGQAMCLLSAGPPVTMGKCTSVVGAGGACTCASF